MLWFETGRRGGARARAAVLASSRAPFLALGLVVGMALGLSGCGFSPLYGRDEPQKFGAQDHLAMVRIAPMPDRVGQELHNLLRDRINPKGQPLNPSYNLRVTVSAVTEELGIREDKTATRANLTVYADFVLTESATDKKLFSGRSRSFSSYNILESQFATLFSEDDASGRALRDISDDIRNRLAVFFARIARQSS